MQAGGENAWDAIYRADGRVFDEPCPRFEELAEQGLPHHVFRPDALAAEFAPPLLLRLIRAHQARTRASTLLPASRHARDA